MKLFKILLFTLLLGTKLFAQVIPDPHGSSNISEGEAIVQDIDKDGKDELILISKSLQYEIYTKGENGAEQIATGDFVNGTGYLSGKPTISGDIIAIPIHGVSVNVNSIYLYYFDPGFYPNLMGQYSPVVEYAKMPYYLSIDSIDYDYDGDNKNDFILAWTEYPTPNSSEPYKSYVAFVGLRDFRIRRLDIPFEYENSVVVYSVQKEINTPNPDPAVRILLSETYYYYNYASFNHFVGIYEIGKDSFKGPNNPLSPVTHTGEKWITNLPSLNGPVGITSPLKGEEMFFGPLLKYHGLDVLVMEFGLYPAGGDPIPDIQVLVSSSEPKSPFINFGGGSLLQLPDIPNISQFYRSSIGDYNLDGKYEVGLFLRFYPVGSFIPAGAYLLVTNLYFGGGMSQLIDVSSPTWGSSVTLDLVDVATGDFNGDGRPDLAYIVVGYYGQTMAEVNFLYSNPSAPSYAPLTRGI